MTPDLPQMPAPSFPAPCSAAYEGTLIRLLWKIEEAQTAALSAATLIIAESDHVREQHARLIALAQDLGRHAELADELRTELRPLNAESSGGTGDAAPQKR